MTSAGALRPVAAISVAGKPLRCAPVAPAPRVAHLAIDQLVIDEGYQRGLSAAGMRLIRRIAESWDWSSYKPLSVAPCGDGRYEVIDGQHTAIGAATNGAIETLPCLVLQAGSVAERAAAFVGINRDRISLTPYALFRARVAAEEPDAVSVQQAVLDAGVELRPNFTNYEQPPAGAVACVSTLLLIQRSAKQPDVLRRALSIGKAAEFAPMPGAALKALAQMIDEGASDAVLTDALLEIGPDDLIDRARARRDANLAPTQVDAMIQVLSGVIDRKEAA